MFGRSEPTVPQAVHDAVVASMRADLTAERARYDALLEKHLSLKMAGAVEVPTVPARVTAPAVPPDELSSLIEEKAGTNYRLRAIMLRQLAADRAASVPDDDIRAAIESGVSSEGIPA